MYETLINVFRHLIKRKTFKVLLNKIFNKIRSKNSKVDLIWLKNNSISWKDYLKLANKEIFEETIKVIKRLINENKTKLDELNVKLGGSANQYLIYFLVRKNKPNVIFETGVAAGHSSRAILHAIKINKKGKLYSSDFPYLRIKNSENYIGILVEDELKKNWELSIEGDKKNISKFLNYENKIDFFHYDSDKSYNGKNQTFNLVKSKMNKGSVMIFDDIQDDNFFKDVVEKHNLNFKVFVFENKFVGILNF